MVLIPMRAILRFGFYVTLLICFSCEEQGWFVKCSECESNEPEKASLEIKLKYTGAIVLINIYEGALEDKVLYFSGGTTGTDYRIPVPLNKEYTATATYLLDNTEYIAVDSAFPRVKYTEDQCDDPCYFVYDKILDLRLKYTVRGN